MVREGCSTRNLLLTIVTLICPIIGNHFLGNSISGSFSFIVLQIFHLLRRVVLFSLPTKLPCQQTQQVSTAGASELQRGQRGNSQRRNLALSRSIHFKGLRILVIILLHCFIILKIRSILCYLYYASFSKSFCY